MARFKQIFDDLYLKTCPRCHTEYEAQKPEEFKAYFTTNSRRVDGLQVWCRACYGRIYEINRDDI